MSAEKKLLERLDYLSTVNTSHDLKNTWISVADEVVDILKNNHFTNISMIKVLFEAIPDGFVKEYIAKNF